MDNYYVLDCDDYRLSDLHGTFQALYGIVGDKEGGYIAYASSVETANMIADALNQQLDKLAQV